MIPELDRYHGVVLRQLLVCCGKTLKIGVARQTGRVDSYIVEAAALVIKHSTKRLSPWQFTYMPSNFADLAVLEKEHPAVWVALVCGQDGVVALDSTELRTLVDFESQGATWIRVGRRRNTMYRVWGSRGELGAAKARGFDGFVTALDRCSKT